MTIERRFLTLDQGAELELRAEGEGQAPCIRGLAVPWEKLSVPLWRDWRSGKPIREKFRRGAFATALATTGLDVVALRDHDRSRLLGRSTSGTLRIAENDRGLGYEIDPPDTSDGRDVVVLLGRRDLKGSSFAFDVRKEEWAEEPEIIVRTIIEVSVFEDISIVTRPAYPDSEATTARSIDAAKAALEAWRGGRDTREMQARALALDA